MGRPVEGALYHRLGLLLGLLLCLLPESCTSGSVPTPQGAKEEEKETAAILKVKGLLIGKVTLGPLSPVEGLPGRPAQELLAGVRIKISKPSGELIETVVTDKKGEYRVVLPPGTYRVEMEPLEHGRWTKDLPTTITITQRKEARLDVRVDTGIR